MRAAFFDLDKTVIAKASIPAFGRPLYRGGMINRRLVARALEHIVTAIVDCVQEMLSDIPPNLAEDVVRGKVRLAGGGALLPGLANRIEAATDIPVLVVDDPLRCVVRGAAEILERPGDLGKHSGPGLRQLPFLRRPGPSDAPGLIPAAAGK